MKASQGFTRLIPTVIVALSFVIGSAFFARAVTGTNVSTTIVIDLRIETVITIIIGTFLLGDRLSPGQLLGVLLVIMEQYLFVSDATRRSSTFKLQWRPGKCGL